MGYKMVRIIAAVMLFIGLGHNPYGYYNLLRFVMCGVSGYGAYISFRQNRPAFTWIFGIIALLFNPIIPFHLDRSTWAIIDILTAMFFLVSIPLKRTQNAAL